MIACIKCISHDSLQPRGATTRDCAGHTLSFAILTLHSQSCSLGTNCYFYYRGAHPSPPYNVHLEEMYMIIPP